MSMQTAKGERSDDPDLVSFVTSLFTASRSDLRMW